MRYGRGELIYDRPGMLSHAYHAYCGALLAELAQYLETPWATGAALRAAQAIRPYISEDGESLTVGRGKAQIFGYGALLYLLEAAAGLSGDEGLRAVADRVFTHLLRFRRVDGSFPLVLNETEPPEPWAPAVPLPGWHDYNRYADYVPFLGVYLLKAARAERARNRGVS